MLKKRSSSRDLMNKLSGSVRTMLMRSNSGGGWKCEQLPPMSPSAFGAVECIAGDLGKLASSPHQCDLLIRLGFVAPLVSMLGGPSEPIQLLACNAIAHLASKKEHHQTLRDAGTLAALLRLLDGSSSPAPAPRLWQSPLWAC